MMVKVIHKQTNEVYYLLGTGYGMYKSQGAAGWFTPLKQEGETYLVAITDQFGEIHFVSSEEIQVISIDGVPVKDFRPHVWRSQL